MDGLFQNTHFPFPPSTTPSSCHMVWLSIFRFKSVFISGTFPSIIGLNIYLMAFFYAWEFHITIGWLSFLPAAILLFITAPYSCSSYENGILFPWVSSLWLCHLSCLCYYIVSEVLSPCEGFTVPFPCKSVLNFYLLLLSYNSIFELSHLNSISFLFVLKVNMLSVISLRSWSSILSSPYSVLAKFPPWECFHLPFSFSTILTFHFLWFGFFHSIYE